MIIKEDIPKHTQVRSDGVTADVDLEDLFFCESLHFFIYEGNFFDSYRMAQRKLNLL